MKTISLWNEIEVDDIIRAISTSLEQDEIIDLIVQLDLDVADWDFTRRLSEKLNDIMKHYGE